MYPLWVKLRADLVVANHFLLAQNQALSAELEYAWGLVSPGFSRSERTRRRSTGGD
jgi:hypothetical protein